MLEVAADHIPAEGSAVAAVQIDLARSLQHTVLVGCHTASTAFVALVAVVADTESKRSEHSPWEAVKDCTSGRGAGGI